MADHIQSQSDGVPNTMRSRYRDMLDTTHALVVDVGDRAGRDLGIVTGNMQVGGADVSFANPLPVNDVWRISNISDLTLNSSSKIILTVPANREYQILFVRANFATTATVGTRQLGIRIEHPAATLTAIWARSAVTQAASLTYEYLFASGLADFFASRYTGAVAPYITTPIPIGAILYAGDVLRVLDNQAIDAAADDLLVHCQVAIRTV